MTSRPPARHYSPDGHYWWDGTAWQPVQPQAPQPPTPRPRPRVPLGQPPGAPGAREPRRRKRVPAVLLVGVVAVVALVVGLAGGWVAGQARDDPGGPAALPAIPAEFPDASQRYLPGVTVSGLTRAWQQQDGAWTCAPAAELPEGAGFSGATQQVECETGPGLENNPSNANDASFLIEFDDETQIRQVSALCSVGPGSQGCAAVFAFVAAAALTGQPDLQQQARDWATQHADSDSAVLIGGVHLAVTLDGWLHGAPAP